MVARRCVDVAANRVQHPYCVDVQRGAVFVLAAPVANTYSVVSVTFRIESVEERAFVIIAFVRRVRRAATVLRTCTTVRVDVALMNFTGGGDKNKPICFALENRKITFRFRLPIPVIILSSSSLLLYVFFFFFN